MPKGCRVFLVVAFALVVAACGAPQESAEPSSPVGVVTREQLAAFLFRIHH